MSNLAICRVCLAGNLPTHSLRGPLKDLFEKLTSFKLSTGNGRPETVCYICHWQLQRCCRFKDKAGKCEEILTQMFRHGIEILPETISGLNKGIQHRFVTTPIESMAYIGQRRDSAASDVIVKQEVTDNPPDGGNEVIAIKPNAVLCRMCLSVDFKTHSIKDTPLQVIFEKLVENKLITEDRRPDIVCFICNSILLKCRKLIGKSRRSEKILAELARNSIQLTQKTVEILNSKMKTNFTRTPVEISLYVPDDAPMPKVKEFKCLPITIKQEHFECTECNRKYNSSEQLEEHHKFHDPSRQFPCDICFNRYETWASLRQHKITHKPKYKCLKCDEIFVKRRQLKSHMLVHTKKEVYNCEYCTQTFKDKVAQRHHCSKAHPARKYACKHCGVKFISKTWLTDHIFKRHTGNYPHYICDICGKQFKVKQLIQRHMVVHIQLLNYKCKVCNKLFHRFASFKHHRYTHMEKKPYECEICSKSFCYKVTLEQHLRNHTDRKPFQCDFCSKTYKDEKYLERHTAKVHTKTQPEAVHICDYCGKSYVSKFLLKEHIITHMTGIKKRYRCKICPKKFASKYLLSRHIADHNGTRVTKKYECEICGKKVTSLSVHMTSHRTDRPYICDICGKSYTGRHYLANHMKYHLDIRPHSCKTCGKQFVTTKHLETHVRTHTGEKPYKCKVCDRAFSQTSQLTRHNLIHTDEQPFKCDLCDRRFREKRAVDQHKTITHATKTDYLICNLCCRVYTNKKDLIRHIKKHRSKQITCEFCKKSFINFSLLAKHMKIHNDEKQICLLCKKEFSSKCGLGRHYQTMHGTYKPYACNVCEEPAMNFLVLNRHININHSDRKHRCEICKQAFEKRDTLNNHIRNIHLKVKKKS